MDTGLVTSRYAKAILRHGANRGVEERIYEDAVAMLSSFGFPQELEKAIGNSCREMKDLLAIVVRNKRTSYLNGILRSIIRLYRKEHRITTASLVSAAEDPLLEGKVRELLAESGYINVALNCEVNPELLGGFVLQIDDKRLDASLSRQLKTIRKELEEKNKRII